jgi:hypothetical protein
VGPNGFTRSPSTRRCSVPVPRNSPKAQMKRRSSVRLEVAASRRRGPPPPPLRQKPLQGARNTLQGSPARAARWRETHCKVVGARYNLLETTCKVPGTACKVQRNPAARCPKHAARSLQHATTRRRAPSARRRRLQGRRSGLQGRGNGLQGRGNGLQARGSGLQGRRRRLQGGRSGRQGGRSARQSARIALQGRNQGRKGSCFEIGRSASNSAKYGHLPPAARCTNVMKTNIRILAAAMGLAMIGLTGCESEEVHPVTTTTSTTETTTVRRPAPATTTETRVIQE